MEHEDMVKQIDNYFEKTTPENFLKDLEEIGCLEMVEDVE